MNVAEYETIRKEFNYEVIHRLVDDVLKGYSQSRWELAGMLSRTVDLSSVVNRHLAKLYHRLVADVIEYPHRKITLGELSVDLIVRIYSLKELREMAKAQKIKGCTKMSAEQLATALIYSCYAERSYAKGEIE